MQIDDHDIPPSASEALFTAGSLALAVRDAIEKRDAAIRQAHAAVASLPEIAVTTDLTEDEVTAIVR